MKKSKLDSVLRELKAKGWTPGLTTESYERIIAHGLRGKNLALACVATEIACDEKPLTLRGLMYRTVSAGRLPSTDKQHYSRLGRLMTTLREAGIVPFSWIVDNVRSTIKPPSWAGLADFADTTRDCYRLDFWARLPEYVHVICEKDAVAGTLAPVTREFDVALSPIRGYVSLSFAHEIADVWNRVTKPIFAYYVGDFDASGFDLERDLRDKLSRYCNREFSWQRLAVNREDFEAFDLIPLKPKKSDRRYKAFVRDHGRECAELDAIPATELRRRVREAIERHIPQDEWDRLQKIEQAERATWNKALERIGKKAS